ncbi:MmgE/PrpD family protein [Chelatococcus asaccharovorans]|uniref:2-methylcitrate dehydratase PrpD n=1 Tax=Chelatococcus asaccharovorans TaxID=28210 RepID=A0A2V3U8P2_9HYPH|nr:MmgE/PrpD family protein [Chelatococcus asaccharovorans]MBS7705676.1 MmgE/PrpD family protein [Chelatococcus asaccharovorans]PXW58694.1 2-methylcitrate dehydratase PrpD [Chelatococcus asaccharovorans]
MNEGTVSAELINRMRCFVDADWDPAIRRRTELCLIDSISCFSAGLGLAHFKPSAVVAPSLFGTNAANDDTSTLSPFLAAYLYGQAANALDYDDTLLGHPGAPIIGAILAVAARERLPMDRLLRGIAAGYEAHWILASSAIPSRERAALVRSVGVWDTVAASIGIAISFGRSSEFLERLVGVAVAHSLLPYTAKWYERPVPALKNNLGWAAAGAVMAVGLVEAGQTGVSNALDGASGMWRMAGSDQCDLTRTRKDQPAVARVGFKQFPACWHLQEYLKSFSISLQQLTDNEEIVAITVKGPAEVEKFCRRDIIVPADVAFSLPATFSLLLAGVEPGSQWDAVANHSPALRYKDRFVFDLSEERSVTLELTSGRLITADVAVSDPTDLASFGLDEKGVLAKSERLTPSPLRSALDMAFTSTHGDPAQLYEAVARMIIRTCQGKPLDHVL